MGVSFVVYGAPVPKGSLRAFVPKGHTRPILTHDSPRTRPWQQAIVAAAVEALDRDPTVFLEGPVQLSVTFFLPRPKSAKRGAQPTKKPDVGKLVRTVEDALTGVLYYDDAQITTEVGRKVYAGAEEDVDRVAIPRAAITVEPDPGGVVSLVRGPVTAVCELTRRRSSVTLQATGAGGSDGPVY